MASSDYEDEAVQNDVNDYKFVDGADEEFVSFANLPVDWSRGGIQDGKQQQIYLSGKTDNGLRRIYIQVTAWKFVLPKEKPEIYVLSVKGTWIKLLKPLSRFNDIIRTVLVTLHALHSAKWNPQRTQRALWDDLHKTLRFDRRPCVDDLADHVPLISEAIKWDKKLAKSKVLVAFLAVLEKSTSNQDLKSPFIVDNVNGKKDWGDPNKADENQDSDSKEGEEADENEDSDQGACAICDNGGKLYSCDGKCMRSFHATVEDGKESKCDSLGLTDAEIKAIKNVPFICDNCKYKKHQCFACGKLGSSDELSNPEVFRCVNGDCGYFYHPHCVERLFHPGHDDEAEELQNKIAAGELFECPIHRCHVCKESEMKSTGDLQFAVCRRCPKAYHRKCLPREIAFGSNEDGIIQRAWEGLIPNRILIYCLNHEIDEDICTPHRDHIVFPGAQQDKRKMLELEFNKKKKLSKGRTLALKDNAGNKISGKRQRANDMVPSHSKGSGLSRKRVEKLPTHPPFKKQKLASARNSCEKLKDSTTDEGGISSNYRSNAAVCGTDSKGVNSCIVATRHGETEITEEDNPTVNRADNTWTLDADAKGSILTLMEHVATSVTLEEVKDSYRSPSKNALYSRFSADQVSVGKVQGSIQAVHAARKKLDGGSVQDAKAFCGDELLEQVLKWKEKLKVYLAPFLCGMRHTSFGRHFTKMDKLKEIVELLHWYVQDGDTVVDFCCGPNDFSCLMKKKFDEMGKICSFRNYDIIQAQNDFNFERRDWMGVNKEELPDGSKLIIGLHPPVGVNRELTDKFINKALEFKPKLLVLIMPPEMQRLDEKIAPYDLIWEDDQMLAGESFYLPESVDVNDKEIKDLSVNAPVLCLWSSPAWTLKHRAIAHQHGHVSGALENHRFDESRNKLLASSSAPAFDDISSSRVEAERAVTSNCLEQNRKRIISHQEGSPRNVYGSEAGQSETAVKNHLKSSSKNSGGKGDKKGPQNEISAPVFDNISSSGVEGEREDTSNYREQKRKKIISHQEGSPRNIYSSEAGNSDTSLKNHLKSSSKSSGAEGNNISSTRVEEAEGADTSNKLEQKRKEIISPQEVSPRDVNDSEAGESETSVKNHLNSSTKNSSGKGNNILSSSRGEAEHADTSYYLERKQKEIIRHQEGSPYNSKAGRSETAVKNHFKSSYNNSGWKRNEERPPHNVVRRNNSFSKRPAFRHESLDVANHFEYHPTERLEDPAQAYYEGGDYWQSNESNLSMHSPHDRMNDFGDYHVGSWRQGWDEYHDERQQYNQCVYEPHSYENNGVIDDVVRKYVDETSMQPYNPRGNPDYGGGMDSAFEYESHGHGFGGHRGRGYHGYSYSYGGTNTPTMQRYASGLNEVFPYQPSPSFAPPPPPPPPPHLF